MAVPLAALGDARTAPLSSRFAAAVVDYLVCVAASYTLFPVLLVVLGLRGLACIVAQLLLIAGYFAVLWAWGATLGMRALSLRLVRSGRRGPLLLWTSLRTALTLPSGISAAALGLIGYVAYVGALPSGADTGPGWERVLVLALVASAWPFGTLWMLVDRRKQPLHDWLCGVRVVDLSPLPRKAVDPPVAQPVKRVTHEASPPRSLSAWLRVLCLMAAFVLSLVGLLLAVAAGQHAVERELGPAIVGVYMTAAAGIGVGAFGRWGLGWPRRR